MVREADAGVGPDRIEVVGFEMGRRSDLVMGVPVVDGVGRRLDREDRTIDDVDPYVEAQDALLELSRAPPDGVEPIEVVRLKSTHDRAGPAGRLEDDLPSTGRGDARTAAGSLVTSVRGTRKPAAWMSWAWYGFEPFDAIAEQRLNTRADVISVQATRRAWSSSAWTRSDQRRQHAELGKMPMVHRAEIDAGDLREVDGSRASLRRPRGSPKASISTSIDAGTQCRWLKSATGTSWWAAAARDQLDWCSDGMPQTRITRSPTCLAGRAGYGLGDRRPPSWSSGRRSTPTNDPRPRTNRRARRGGAD